MNAGTAAAARSKASSAQTSTDINSIFGSSTKLWINTSSAAGKTLSGEFSTKINSLFSNDANAYSFSNISTPKLVFCNNKWFTFLHDTEGILNASKSNFNLLHDGTDWLIGFRLMILRGLNDFYPIVSNNNGTTTQTGIFISYDNRSASSRTHALNFNITKSSAGNTVYTGNINNFFEEGVWVTCIMVKSGTTLSVYKATDSASTPTISQSFSRTNTPVTSNATQDFNLFKDSGSAKYMRYALFKHLHIITGSTTSGQRLSSHQYMCEGDAIGDGERAYVYWLQGQSNMEGFSTSPPGYLQNEINCYIWGHTSNSGDDTTTFSKLHWPNNQNTGKTEFGAELEFGYRMSLLKPGQVWLIKTALSATPLYLTGGGNDWNVASASTEMAGRANAAIFQGVNQLVFELNKSVKLAGWDWRQGTTDAGNGNASYKTDLYALVKKYIDTIYATPSGGGLLTGTGVNTSKMRGVISLVDTPFHDPTRDFQASIVTAQQAFVSDFFNDNPTYVGKWLGNHSFSTSDLVTAEGTHFGANETVEQGLRFYNTLAPYIDE